MIDKYEKQKEAQSCVHCAHRGECEKFETILVDGDCDLFEYFLEDKFLCQNTTEK